MNLKELKDKKIGDLNDMAKQLGIENGSGLRKQDLIFEILSHLSQREPAFQRYFEADWVFAERGYPFGIRVDLAKALGACARLSAR